MKQRVLRRIFSGILILIPTLVVFAQYHFPLFGIPWYVPEMGVVMAFLIFLAFRERRFEVRNRFLWYAVGLLLIGLLWSMGAHTLSPHGYGRMKSWFFFPVFYAYLLTFAVRKAWLLREDVMLALFFGGIGVGIGVLPSIFFGTAFSYDHRLHGFFDSPNQLAMILGTALFFGSARQLFSSGGRWRSLFFFFGALFLLMLLLQTQSYEVFFSLAVVMLIFLVAQYRQMPFRMVLIFLGVLFFSLFSILSLSGEKWRGVISLDARSSLASRQMIWHSAIRMIADSPLTGIGPGNFQAQYLVYQRYFLPYLEWSVPHPHNMFLDVWLEGGILGACGLVLVFSVGCALSIRNFLNKKNKEHLSPLLSFLILVYFLCIGAVDVPFLGNGLAYFFVSALTVCFIGISDRFFRHDD